MHEYFIIESLVASMLDALKNQPSARPVAIRFRRGSAFSEEALRQAYASLTARTRLADATVEIETVNLDFVCRCGHRQIITSDDLVGHMFVCPRCGATREIDEAHDLELVEFLAEDVA